MSWIIVLFTFNSFLFFTFCHGQSYVLRMGTASEWISYVASVLCQRVWAWSSAQPHTSAQLQAKLFDLGLASRLTALPRSPPLPPQGLAESLLRPCQPPPIPCSIRNSLPTWPGCSRSHRQNDGDDEAQNNLSPSRVGPLSCPIPSSTLFQGKTANVHTLAWLWSLAFSQGWLKSQQLLSMSLPDGCIT